jgi:hypothetical protein
MNRRLVLVVVAMIAGSAAWSDEKAPLRQFIGNVQRQFAQRCDESRELEKSALDENSRMKGRMGVSLQCECMPPEIEKLAQRSDLPRDVTQDEALALLRPALEHCGAQTLRSMLVSSCPSGKAEPGIKDRKAYCNCLSGAVAKFSDQQVAAEALEAHADFEARVAAKRDGKPEPPKRKGVMDAAEKSCRGAQGAASGH